MSNLITSSFPDADPSNKILFANMLCMPNKLVRYKFTDIETMCFGYLLYQFHLDKPSWRFVGGKKFDDFAMQYGFSDVTRMTNRLCELNLLQEETRGSRNRKIFTMSFIGKKYFSNARPIAIRRGDISQTLIIIAKQLKIKSISSLARLLACSRNTVRKYTGTLFQKVVKTVKLGGQICKTNKESYAVKDPLFSRGGKPKLEFENKKDKNKVIRPITDEHNLHINSFFESINWKMRKKQQNKVRLIANDYDKRVVCIAVENSIAAGFRTITRKGFEIAKQQLFEQQSFSDKISDRSWAEGL